MSASDFGPIAALFQPPFDPGNRLYWPFIVSSLLLASAWVAWQNKGWRGREQLQQLVRRDYWLQRDSVIDLALLLFNNFLKVSLLVPLLFTQLSGTVWVINHYQHWFGMGPHWQAPTVALSASFTLLFFLFDDFSRFILHWLLHRLPWLWHFHKVHHTATNLTPFTLYRVHPVEMVLYYVRSLALFSVLSGSFIYLFQGSISGWEILGANVFAFAFNALGANLRHSPIAVHFGSLERWFISPAQHQLHHSAAAEHANKNLGSALAVWDRYFGSWLPGRHANNLMFGLAEPSAPAPLKPVSSVTNSAKVI